MIEYCLQYLKERSDQLLSKSVVLIHLNIVNPTYHEDKTVSEHIFEKLIVQDVTSDLSRHHFQSTLSGIEFPQCRTELRKTDDSVRAVGYTHASTADKTVTDSCYWRRRHACENCEPERGVKIINRFLFV